eukprot:4843045-Amphidinium_carterae.4
MQDFLSCLGWASRGQGFTQRTGEHVKGIDHQTAMKTHRLGVTALAELCPINPAMQRQTQTGCPG